MSTIARADLVDAIRRTRDVVADPDRVVHDPLHYVEIGDGPIDDIVSFRDLYDASLERRRNCRVCFMGAASIAAIEAGSDANLSYGDTDLFDDALVAILAAGARSVDITPDDEVAGRWSDDGSVLLTSALMQNRAVEVCDAAASIVAEPDYTTADLTADFAAAGYELYDEVTLA